MLKKGTFLCTQETKHCTCLSPRVQQHHEPWTELKITCAVPSVQPQHAGMEGSWIHGHARQAARRVGRLVLPHSRDWAGGTGRTRTSEVLRYHWGQESVRREVLAGV